MKKFISGRRYDTGTAKLVGYTSYSIPGDLSYWWEGLYRKRTGEFFLHGEGGPMSKYSRPVGQNEWSGGHEIIPLSLCEAQKWAEKHLSADEYEEIFGRVSESKVQVGTWVDLGTKEKISDLRKEKGITLVEIIEAGVKALSEK